LAQPSRLAEKLTLLSFRGAQRAEESAYFLSIEKKQIPRFARDDKLDYFLQIVKPAPLNL
jgi:hypothetical protein